MKKTFICSLLLLLVGTVSAQYLAEQPKTIFSPGFWYCPQTQDPIPWFSLETSKGVVIDARYNFDYKNAVSFYVGKKFQLGQNWTLKPEGGFTVGQSGNTLGTVNYLSFKKGRVNLLLNVQGNLGIDKQTPVFYFYNWQDFYLTVVKEKPFSMKIGLTHQMFWVTPAPSPSGELGVSLRMGRGPFNVLCMFWLAKYNTEGIGYQPRFVLGGSYDIDLD
jgi:hypothetical protein